MVGPAALQATTRAERSGAEYPGRPNPKMTHTHTIEIRLRYGQKSWQTRQILPLGHTRSTRELTLPIEVQGLCDSRSFWPSISIAHVDMDMDARRADPSIQSEQAALNVENVPGGCAGMRLGSRGAN